MIKLCILYPCSHYLAGFVNRKAFHGDWSKRPKFPPNVLERDFMSILH